MNITKENSGNLTAIIKIELKKEDYQEKVKKILNDYQKKAIMPGFRKGKVPFGMINKMYGKSVLAEEINKIVSETLNQYIIDEKLDILGYPLPNNDKTKNIDFDTPKELEFFFDIGFASPFEITLDEKIKVYYYNISVDEKTVGKYLDNLRLRFGKNSNPDSADEKDILRGNIVEVDENNNIIKNGMNRSVSINLNSISIKTAAKKFIGAKIGDEIVFDPKSIANSTSEIASILSISKQEAEAVKNNFQITITGINRYEPAEINEAFFKMVYPKENIENIDQLKKKIENDAAISFVAESDRKFLNDTIEKLIEIAHIKLPNDFLKRWILENSQGKMTKEQVENQYDNYVKSVKWQLIEAKIVKEYDINVTEDEMRMQVKSYFLGMQEKNDEESEKRLNEIVESVLKSPEESKRIHNQLYDKKLLDLFRGKVKKINKTLHYDEFVNLATQIK